MLRACLLAILVFAPACGGGGGPDDDDPDAGPDPDPDASSVCDLTPANPCPMQGSDGDYQAGGQIDGMNEHVWTVVPTAAGAYVLSGSSASIGMQFAVDADPGVACPDAAAFCTAGDPCSGVSIDLTADTTYYVKVCYPFDGTDVPYNVFVRLP